MIVAVTYRRKTERRDPRDKVVHLLAAVPHAQVQTDSNDFLAPVVVVEGLSEADVARLRDDPDVLAVEPITGRTRALGESVVALGPGPQIRAVGASRYNGPPNWGFARMRGGWLRQFGTGLDPAGRQDAHFDTGIDPTHPDLLETVAGGINLTGGLQSAWDDLHGHGTGTWGCVVQMAPDARAFALKVLGDDGTGEWGWLLDGLAYVNYYGAARFRLVTMSIGGTGAPSVALEALCRSVQAKGIPMLVAAGNSYPTLANPGGTGEIEEPARYATAITGTGPDDRVAPFSCRGAQAVFAAPAILVPTVARGGAGYSAWTGTSFAQPLVAGAAAVIMAARPATPLATLAQKAVVTAERLPGQTGWAPEFGYGLLDSRACLLAT